MSVPREPLKLGFVDLVNDTAWAHQTLWLRLKRRISKKENRTRRHQQAMELSHWSVDLRTTKKLYSILAY